MTGVQTCALPICKIPFEIQEINIRPDGFLLTFTLPVDPVVAAQPGTYSLTTYTHKFSAGYGSPEVDHTTPVVSSAKVSDDGLSVRLVVKGIQESHIHDFDLAKMQSRKRLPLLHTKAYYTVNEIPAAKRP